MDLSSVRMTSNLNALSRGRQDVGQAAAAIRADDVAHHVLDPEGVLDLDPLSATDLPTALVLLADVERDGWTLGLPAPGSLPPLRGPRHLNEAALRAGQVVLALTAGVALVPMRVGRGVQWRLYPAERPVITAAADEAERALNEAVLGAARTLAALDVAAGRRPSEATQVRLAAGYGPRQVATANRTVYLLSVCHTALENDGASVTSYEAEVRLRTLRALRAAAREALCAACRWPEDDR